MNFQPIFDAAYTSISEQGAPGYDQTRGTCSYFSKDINGHEMRCAIGHLLPDQMARELGSTMQCMHNLADQINPAVAERFGLDISDNTEYWTLVGFLTRLQTAHDEAAEVSTDEEFLSGFRREMREVAKSFALSTEVLDR
jgi:hypothetical protein